MHLEIITEETIVFLLQDLLLRYKNGVFYPPAPNH